MTSWCKFVLVRVRSLYKYKDRLSCYRDSHHKEETVVTPSNLYTENPHTSKTTFLWWDAPVSCPQLPEPILTYHHSGRVTIASVHHWFREWLSTCSALRQYRTNAASLFIEPHGTNFSEIWIKLQQFSNKKMHLKKGGHFVSTSVRWLGWPMSVVSIMENSGRIMTAPHCELLPTHWTRPM